MKTPYGKTLQLKKDLTDTECWNSSEGATATLPAGMFVTIQHPYDATSTTLLAATEVGMLKAHPDIQKGGILLSNGYKGYRFIVPNNILADALEIEMDEKTEDIVGDIIVYETTHCTNTTNYNKTKI